MRISPDLRSEKTQTFAGRPEPSESAALDVVNPYGVPFAKNFL